MPKTRPNNYEIKSPEDLKNWFEKKPDSFCYVNGKTRQNWFIGHNSLVIFGKSEQLNFKDITGGVWLVTVKENKTDGKKTEDSQGSK